MKIFFLATALVFVSLQLTFSQKLATPSEGKSLVYLIRTAGAGALINFRYFDGDKYIGKFSGRNYVVYECEPGEHLFWANAENRDFLTATLEADKVYMIHAAAEMGMIKARIRLTPFDKNNVKLMKRSNKLLAKKQPTKFVSEDIEQRSVELREYIKISLEKYEKNLAKDWNYPVLSADMNH